ncbi:MAG: ATP-binding protein [Chloroflexota bacterium]
MDTLREIDKVSVLRLAFPGLETDELEEMAGLTRLCTYPMGHVLCREGAYEEVFYIIAEGSVIITKRISEQEGERVLRIMGTGDWIGEMALIQNAPRAATVRACSECTVLEMDKADFEAMLSRSPRMAINIIRITLDRMRENDRMAIEDLKRANKILRQLDRNKLEFIQVAAHELRTPMTVLAGYVSLLDILPEVKAIPAFASALEGISKGANRMNEVVNLMLDVTRMDNEPLKVTATPIPVRRIARDVIAGFANAAADRRITLTVEADASAPDIYADPTLIQKALYHLIVNAVKYTPDGGNVTVRTRPILMDDDAPGVEVSVRDTGIGLDPEHHELVFEKFYQVGNVALHSSGKTKFKGGGPGLGLAIVRGVARLHGGKTWVESAGHDEVNFPGCAFYLQLPVRPPAA